MAALLPVAVYGLKVPAGDVMVPSLLDFPATFRLTMAAIDPTAEPEHTGTANGDVPPRATLKLIYDRSSPAEDDDDSEGDMDGEDYLRALMEGQGSDEDIDEDDESSSDEEANGGPSDPSKTRKARKQAAAEQIMKALAENMSEDEMDVDGVNGVNGDISKKRNKGKGKAVSGEEEEDSEDEDVDEADMEEIVMCTLDPQKNYQQTLDLTIGEDQRAFFKVSGTHAVYLSGNYVIPAESVRGHTHDDSDDDDDESGYYDLSPGEEELDEEDESDELDNLEDPRVTEVGTDEEEEKAPKLVKDEPAAPKGKNKRAAEEVEDEPLNLDDILSKSLKPESATNGEPKLSKKQLKKLKNNAGKAVEAAVEDKKVMKEEPQTNDSPATKTDKKVQFAKNLEQGPSGTSKDKKDTKADAKAGAKEPKAEKKAEAKVNGETPTATLGVKTLQGGVKVDDRKLGKGPACKKGNKVGMRYIGKLMDGKVFDGKSLNHPVLGQSSQE
ncbi:MAG: hypothetical protein Q9220_000640 [cf. Caloplaca sp. 1 TL-2023]